MRPRWHLLNEGCGRGDINIFFAGAGFTHSLLYDLGARKRLVSWHANTDDDIDQVVEHDKQHGDVFLIVDSGAFTVWNKGSRIKLSDYFDRLATLLHNFDVAANLDVIPGKRGMRAQDITPAMTEAAAQEGWDNYTRLVDDLTTIGFDGLQRVMPIYHQGESMDWLRKMVDYGAPYIGISPSNDYRTTQREYWLDDVFDYLRSLPSLPKTHGYAVTSTRLMQQYEWFSVDSASWIHLGAYGAVNTPFGPINLTDRIGVTGKADGIDGSNWSKEMRQQLDEYFAAMGLTISALKSNYQDRWKANAHYILHLEKTMGCKPKPKPTGLFDITPVTPKLVSKSKPIDTMQDCFGVMTDNQLGEVPMPMYDARKQQ